MKNQDKSLFLVRHAKAEKQRSGLGDHERPLHPEGIAEAQEIATRLYNLSELPQLIISSSAHRAISTALIFQRVLKVSLNNFKINEQLYEVDINSLHEFICGIDDRYQSVMLFGHNPSFSEYATTIDPSILHMSTGSVVKFDFQVEKWRHTSYINAVRKFFEYP